METKCILFISIIAVLLQTRVETQLTNMVIWPDIVSDLGLKYAQENIFTDVNNTLCTDHFQMFLDNLKLNSDWALRMLDSSTRIPENVMMGQNVFLGNFDECIEVENIRNESESFNGQHCLVTLSVWNESLPIQPNNNILPISGLEEKTGNFKSSERSGVIIDSIATISVSYCIPSTCSAEDFEVALNSYLANPINASVSDAYCHTSQGRDLNSEDWVMVVLLIFIILLVISSTAYDLIKKENKKQIFTTFSAFTNGKKLLSTKSTTDSLDAMHGMKFITMCWIVWGNRYTLDISVPAINAITFTDFIADASMMHITNGSIAADTFLFLSGLLVSYVFLNQTKHKSSGFNIPLYYLHRYIRLTPPYAIIIFFEATLVRYLASGPLLSAVTDKMADNCQKYWWTNLLYVNNYVETDHMCVGQSWYLAVDMQLFLLSPLILYPLWKFSPKLNIFLLCILTVAGFLAPFIISYAEDFSANILTGNLHRLSEQQRYLYLATHSRFGPWVIGIAFGYLIYETRRRKWELSTIQIIVGWILSNTALLGSLNGAISFYQPDAEKTVLQSAFYNGLFRNTWAFGVGVTLYLCVSGYGGPPNGILTWKIFPTVSRLTYCMFLTHGIYQVIQTYSARTPIYISILNVWPLFFGDVIVCLVLATLLSLFVEAPMIAFEKCILRRGRRKTTAENHLQIISPDVANMEANINI